MVESVLIIVCSVVLLVYWFRYSCLLLLRDSAAELQYQEHDQRFGFARVNQQLQAGATLDPLHRELSRDYHLLTYLLDHAAGLNLPTLEDRLLVMDYRIMQWYYRLTKAVFPSQARHALGEMAAVLSVLVRHMSDQAGLQARA